MSYERFPATKLHKQAKDDIKICESIGLSVKSEVRVKDGVLAYHTVKSPDGTVHLEDGYNRDLHYFVSGIKAIMKQAG